MGPFAVAGSTGWLCRVMTIFPAATRRRAAERGLHEGFPVAAGGVGFVARVAGDDLRGFRGADSFASVTVCFALGEELEDGGFEGGVLFAGAVAAAGFAAKFEDVPVAGVLFGPVEGALAGLAEFFFVWGGAVGFGFAVGHGRRF
jgi:hypothetical protein